MSDLPIESMLRDVKLVEGFTDMERWSTTDLVRDLCCHIKALAAEVERLEKSLALARKIIESIKGEAASAATESEASDAQS